MNNDQFRRLVFEDSAAKPTAAARKDAATSSVLGSRMRSSIPMTPRSVVGSSGIDFARQLREANAPAQKKFRSTAAPKGTKLASGYVDRTQLRASAEEDEKAARIKSLEEMVKLGQMDQATFEKVRDEIIGGDISNVHLVKGLDRKLLERARRGENVYEKPGVKEPAKVEEEAEEVDVEAALDELEDKDVVPVERKEKKREDAGSVTVVGKKRTRDDILKELKAARSKAQEAAAPALSSKFRKLGAKLELGTSRIEIDNNGREVLITVDQEGNVKRKVRKAKASAPPAAEQTNGLLMPDKDAIPLGADAPVIPQRAATVEEPSEDEDIFEGVGAEYDPLGGGDDSASDSSEESGEEKDVSKKQDPSEQRKRSPQPRPPKDDVASMPPPPQPSKPRNYFNDKPSDTPENAPPSNPLQDPSFRAFLEKASSLARKTTDSDDEEEDPEAKEEARKKLARRKAMLEAHDRDAEDMDLGFGSSRFEDQEEGEEGSVRLSKWKGDGEGDEGGGGKDRGGQGQRKRGKKKKKGDKNSMNDVLAVLDRRGKA